MHELSIAISLLEVAEEESQRHGGGKVVALHLRVGPLSGVVKEALLGAFGLARESMGMDDCRLLIEETPILLNCAVCQKPQPAEGVQDLRCTVCDTPTNDLASGRELELFAMELAEEPIQHSR